MPSHRHNTSFPICESTSHVGSLAFQRSDITTGTLIKSGSSVGGDESHNNLQPYYVTYIWKRTA